MSDLVRKQDVIYALVEKGQSSKQYKIGDSWELNLLEIKEAVDAIPSVEPERTAKVTDNVIHVICCEKCERVVSIIDEYCPGCGAKLDWSENGQLG